MKLKLIILASAAAIATSACKSPTQVANTAGVVKTETLGQTEGAIHKVLYGIWTAIDVNSLPVDGTDRPYIEFGSDPTNPFLVRCYAYDGCNYLNGEYAVTPGGSMKRTSEFISTMKMCEGAKYELGMALAMNEVTNYKIEKVGLEYLLYFQTSEGKNLMVMRKFESDFINGAWKVTSINGASVNKDLELNLVFDLNDNTVHGNVGCNTMNGRIKINPDVQNSLTLTDMATTRMTCPDISTEYALLQALGTVNNVQPGGDDSSAVLRNADGNAVVTLERIKLK